MRRNIFIPTVIFGGAFAFGSSDIMAKTFGVEYTTEWQTDFRGGYDWLNLLKTSAEVPVCRALSFSASTISVAKTGELTLVDDLLTYSNIEAGNIPLTIARAGFGIEVGEAQFFVGINNVNEDYFTSDFTSFFINSSCGITPTISCNYDIANYPLSAWCVHYRQSLGYFSLQSSFYPGKGYYRLFGHDNLFNLNFKRDGIFSISSIDYKRNGIYCILGVAMHYGVCIDDENGEQIEAAASPSKKRFSTSPWILSEISLPHNLGLHAHASFSTVRSGCKAYAGIGLLYSGKRFQPGISLNYASFTTENETAIELGSRFPLLDNIYIHPSVHLVKTEGRSPRCVGMLRLSISI